MRTQVGMKKDARIRKTHDAGSVTSVLDLVSSVPVRT